ncbi:hypothetical protein Lal_00026755 [Lupinus albus]|nr:hypothetical protein Lal_00026755 [Lupinus albus]
MYVGMDSIEIITNLSMHPVTANNLITSPVPPYKAHHYGVGRTKLSVHSCPSLLVAYLKASKLKFWLDAENKLRALSGSMRKINLRALSGSMRKINCVRLEVLESYQSTSGSGSWKVITSGSGSSKVIKSRQARGPGKLSRQAQGPGKLSRQARGPGKLSKHVRRGVLESELAYLVQAHEQDLFFLLRPFQLSPITSPLTSIFHS